MPGRGFLLVRRGGFTWGVENAAVRGLVRRGTGFRIALGKETEGTEGTLWADEVLGVVPDLDVRPLTPVLRRFWPEAAAGAGGAGGVAVHAAAPLVIVDPRVPPRALSEGFEGEAEDVEGSD